MQPEPGRLSESPPMLAPLVSETESGLELSRRAGRCEEERQHVGNWLDRWTWFEESGVTLEDLTDPEVLAIHGARETLGDQCKLLAGGCDIASIAAAIEGRAGLLASMRLEESAAGRQTVAGRLGVICLDRGEIGGETNLARRIRRRRIEDARARAYERGASGLDVREIIEQFNTDLDSLETSIEIREFGVTGPGLEAIGSAPDPESPLPGYLDPEPSLQILHGAAKTGKTSLAWLLGLAWATGRPPWDGAPDLPGSRVLILSAEQGLRKCLRVLRRLARTADLGRFDEWRDQITIVGRHAEMTDVDRRLLTFDTDGIALLNQILETAQREGNPFGLVIADSLSRLKPAGANTQENDDMIAVLDPLASVSIERSAYLLLIHHDGHSSERKGQALDGVRGASSIRDVPQGLIAVSRIADKPRQRMIRIAGNELADLSQVFDVAGETEIEGHINRFQPAVGERALELELIFTDGPLSMTEFGRRAFGWAPERAPSGGAKAKATATLESFEKQGLVKREGAGWDLK